MPFFLAVTFAPRRSSKSWPIRSFFKDAAIVGFLIEGIPIGSQPGEGTDQILADHPGEIITGKPTSALIAFTKSSRARKPSSWYSGSSPWSDRSGAAGFGELAGQCHFLRCFAVADRIPIATAKIAEITIVSAPGRKNTERRKEKFCCRSTSPGFLSRRRTVLPAVPALLWVKSSKSSRWLTHSLF